MESNRSIEKRLEQWCQYIYWNITKSYEDENLIFCPAVHDQVLCWMPSRPNQIAFNQCPSEFKGHVYNTFEMAEKYCYPNGTWMAKANYDHCYNISQDNSVLFWVYIIGYSLSFISLCTAFVIFTYLKTLRCLRNIIHCNLIISFIIRVTLWALIYASNFSKPWPPMVNNILFALHISSQLSNFFWMFVEGLYLFIVIVWTYRIEKIKIWHFCMIGWVLPLVLTIIWVIVTVSQQENDWVSYKGSIKLIVHLPIILILVVNLIVLIFLVITLVNKLKATSNFHTAKKRNNQFGPLSVEYKKALKSTVVLMPLLGFSHIIFICNPPKSQFAIVFKIFNAVLSSSQGFLVSVIYCFFNGEVRSTIKNHILNCGQYQGMTRSRHTIYNIPGHRHSVPLANQRFSDTGTTLGPDNNKQIISMMQKLKQTNNITKRFQKKGRHQPIANEYSDISTTFN